MVAGSVSVTGVAGRYRVVYRGRVAVRSERSLRADVVGFQRAGDVVRVEAVHGHWVRLTPEECQRLRVPEAWMLTDGQRQGLGPLLERYSEQDAALDAAARLVAASPQQAPAPSTSDWVLSVGVEDEFEECIDLHWKLEVAPGVEKLPPRLTKTVIEMVIDRSEPGSKALSKPPKDAMVKKVDCEDGKDQAQLVMPSGRRFLVSVVGFLPDGEKLRSAWIQAKTLSERTRAKGFGSVDPVGKTRLACLGCPCSGYIMTKWSSNSRNKGRCRRCGCGFEDHQVGNNKGLSFDALEEMVEQYKRELHAQSPFKDPPPLPDDALQWSPQEVDIFLRTDGCFVPRRTGNGNRPSAPSEGSTRSAGKPGRVSVIVPTTESRQSFHTSLWACFEAQMWEDKELVVVETYTSSSSSFLSKKARKDQRLKYVGFKRAPDNDWSIGLKRNICSQLATGEFIAHFDDDDLYAPAYLSTLLEALRAPKVQGVKLASWFIFDKERGVFAHCDPVDCGRREGKNETDTWIRKWLYGYGFSYVYRRQAAMECPYRDLNLGEDYEFFSSLQEMKGYDSIVLLGDQTGLCLHLQHGGNTSDTQHLVDRLLSREEVSDLEVADLRPVFDEYMRRFPKKRIGVDKDKAQPHAPVQRRLRSVVVRTVHGDIEIECWAGATADELLQRVEESVGMLPLKTEVFWVPPPDQATENVRVRHAAMLLRLDAGQAVAAVQQAESDPELDPELAKLVRSVMDAVPLSERVGGRTHEVWLRLPELGPDGRSSDHVRVTTEQEKLAPKSICRVFHVQLGESAKISDLRHALAVGLPDTASVFMLKPTSLGGAKWVALEDSDFVPDKVRVSAFVAQVTPDMVLRFGQCLEVYTRMFHMVVRPDVQAFFHQLEEESEGNEQVYRAFLLQYLGEKLYPAIAPYFGVPDGNLFLNVFVKAIQVHMNADGELALHRAWLQVETAMHNRTQMEAATRWIEAGGVWNLGETGSPLS